MGWYLCGAFGPEPIPEGGWGQVPSCRATVKMYGIEWSRVSREAVGSYFCGSFAPEPITEWVWCEVRMRIEATLPGSVASGCSVWSLRARSIQACAWYSAECSLVYVSRMERLDSPASGSGTV